MSRLAVESLEHLCSTNTEAGIGSREGGAGYVVDRFTSSISSACVSVWISHSLIPGYLGFDPQEHLQMNFWGDVLI